MTTRQRAIEAAENAMLDFTLEEWVDIEAAATAALDAILDVLGEPGEEMVEAGLDANELKHPRARQLMAIMMRDGFRAMLATLARKEG
jgi:hypothetical protein